MDVIQNTWEPPNAEVVLVNPFNEVQYGVGNNVYGDVLNAFERFPTELECGQCNEISKTRDDHRKHMLKHEKPFKCDIPGCKREGKGFTTVNDLNRHKKSYHRINAFDGSYQCASSNCRSKEKIWPRLDNFKQHVERMHPDEDAKELIRKSEYDTSPKAPIYSPPLPTPAVDQDLVSSGGQTTHPNFEGHNLHGPALSNTHISNAHEDPFQEIEEYVMVSPLDFTLPVRDSVSSHERVADDHGWQVGGEKFVPFKEAHTLLRTEKRLGNGSIGEVEEVVCTGATRSLARKRIAISRRKRLADRELELVEKEISHMKKLRHPHIVQILGSYQEGGTERPHFFCLLMYPVGQNDLSTFLDETCKCIKEMGSFENPGFTYRRWIIRWLTCLPSALAYMHSQHIHHEDIKPRNIVHREGTIYFTDFSSSRSFEAGQQTSTANPARATHLFAAPEALPLDDYTVHRHGSKSDVFSLGLVLVEMLTVLAGSDVDSLHEFLESATSFDGPADQPGGHSFSNYRYRQYHRVVHLFTPWFESLHKRLMGMTWPTIAMNQNYLDRVLPMLNKERESRPSALEVYNSAHFDRGAHPCHCGASISSN